MKVRVAVFTVAVLCAVSLVLAAAVPAQGFLIRLEKDVPESAVTGKPTIEVKMYTSPLLSADPLVTELISPAKAWVAVYTSLTGEKLYNVRLDFSETALLTRDMELWWDLYVSNNRIGRREPVPQSAWSLFSVEADMADTAGDADTVDGLHAADIVAGAVPDGSITTAKLADNAVTAVKLAADSVWATQIGPGAVGTSEVADGSVTSADIDAATVQQRVTGTCGAGWSVRIVNSNGTVVCEQDTDTNTNAVSICPSGTFLNGDGTCDTLQARVQGACGVGSSIRSINSNGTVACEQDSDAATRCSNGYFLNGDGTCDPVSGVQEILSVSSEYSVSHYGGGSNYRDIFLGSTAGRFCALVTVRVTDTDGTAETAGCNVDLFASGWWLRAYLALPSDDANVVCTARCITLQ